jgi:hypothetical protein
VTVVVGGGKVPVAGGDGAGVAVAVAPSVGVAGVLVSGVSCVATSVAVSAGVVAVGAGVSVAPSVLVAWSVGAGVSMLSTPRVGMSVALGLGTGAVAVPGALLVAVGDGKADGGGDGGAGVLGVMVDAASSVGVSDAVVVLLAVSDAPASARTCRRPALPGGGAPTRGTRCAGATRP